MNLSGKIVLVTGGTRGIGLATGLAYARCGAEVILTFRWGTADEAEVKRRFIEQGSRAPMIIRADVANEDDTHALFDEIAQRYSDVHILISNVAFAPKIESLSDWKKRDLFRSIEYTAWPLWSYTERIHARLGRWPTHVIGLSCDGPEHFYMSYDFVAISKAVMETMCRYMTFRLRGAGTCVNIIRSRLVETDSFIATFGADYRERLQALADFEDLWTSPEEIADVALALGSGLLNAIRGQVLMVDKGYLFSDNMMSLLERQRSEGKEETEDERATNIRGDQEAPDDDRP